MVSFFKKAFASIVSLVMIVTLSACGNKDAEEKGDYLSGNKWETSSGMLLSLDTDGTFKWYNNKAERNNNYYAGNFTLMVGKDAIDYLVKEQGLTEEGQRSALAEYSIAEEDYYAIVMNNKECIQDGNNTLEEENEVTYYGYYLPKYETLKLYNMGNLTPYEFSKM